MKRFERGGERANGRIKGISKRKMCDRVWQVVQWKVEKRAKNKVGEVGRKRENGMIEITAKSEVGNGRRERVNGRVKRGVKYHVCGRRGDGFCVAY